MAMPRVQPRLGYGLASMQLRVAKMGLRSSHHIKIFVGRRLLISFFHFQTCYAPHADSSLVMCRLGSPSFYFDVRSGECKVMNGGCTSREDRFWLKKDCERMCMKKTATKEPDSSTTKKPDSSTTKKPGINFLAYICLLW